jgi:tetratricopeptide (TPR) repeat protein
MKSNQGKTFRRKPTTTLAAGLTVAAAVVLAGCAGGGQSQHDEWVEQADTRYKSLRTGLIMEMAQQHFDAGDLENAERSVKDAMEIDPTSAKLLTLAGRIKLERGRLERAYHLFNMAIEQAPDRPEAYYYQGLVLQRWKRFDEAEKQYSKAYDLEADNVAYLIAWGEMLVEAGEVERAIELLESKRNYFDQSSGLRVTLGQLYLFNDRAEQAAEALRQAAVLDPDNKDMNEILAMAEAAAGNHGEAIQLLRELLSTHAPGARPDLKRALADACRAAGRVEEARRLYVELARGSDGAEHWLTLAEMAYREQDEAGTLYAARKALENDPSLHGAYVLSGLVWQKRGRLEEALRMYDLAADTARDDATPLILRGIALQKAGKTAAAAESYRRALDRSPEDQRARQLLESVTAASAS